MKTSIMVLALLSSGTTFAHAPQPDSNSIKAVYADLSLLKQANIPTLFADDRINVGYAVINGNMEQRLSELAHLRGRCGNYEALSEIPNDINIVKNNFDSLNKSLNQSISYSLLGTNQVSVVANEKIVNALTELKSENIKTTVAILSANPTRYNKAPEPNKPIENFLANSIIPIIQSAAFSITAELVAHKSTPQKSIRVSIKGSTKPDEIIVLGGHIDSINGWGGTGRAPGADDNASGSASLLEALRVLTTQKQPQRTVEFYWYAGEESGLLGSAEIAKAYKAQSKNVVAVLQLDMTMFPGDGVFKIASINDFTSPWLRDYLKAINATYLNVEIMDDQCGYGCSDHASWHRQGYPALMPTEAKFNSMFKYLHTDKDVISPIMSFEHSLVFSKIALIMAMDLGNSAQRETLF